MRLSVILIDGWFGPARHSWAAVGDHRRGRRLRPWVLQHRLTGSAGRVLSSAVSVRVGHRLPKLDEQTLITDRLGADLPFAEGAELHDHAARVARGGAAPA
jgi:hypothetical protein